MKIVWLVVVAAAGAVRETVLVDQLTALLEPSPEDTPATEWDELSCTSILVHQPLVVTGDVIVNGRIQVIASSNLTLYDEENESEQVNRASISKFAKEKCSRTAVNNLVHGDLSLPHSNLIIGGEYLVVGGKVRSHGVTLDGGSIMIVRGRDLRTDGGLVPAICSQSRDEVTLKVTHGMIYLKNASKLIMKGSTQAPTIGLDRASQMIVSCGGINALDSTQKYPGDIAILGSSELVLLSSPGISSHSLVVGENSSAQLSGAISVDDFKLAGYAAVHIPSGSVEAKNLLLVTNHSVLVLAVTKTYGEAPVKCGTGIVIGLGGSVRVMEAAVGETPTSKPRKKADSQRNHQQHEPLLTQDESLSNIIYQLNTPSDLLTHFREVVSDSDNATYTVRAGAVEIGEGSECTLASGALEVNQHVVVDDWSTLRTASLRANSFVSVENASSVYVAADLDTDNYLRVLSSSSLSVATANVTCGLVASLGSTVQTGSMTIRQSSDTVLQCGEVRIDLSDTVNTPPALLVSKSSRCIVHNHLDFTGNAMVEFRSILNATDACVHSGGLIVNKYSHASLHDLVGELQFVELSGLSKLQVTSGRKLAVNALRVSDNSGAVFKAQDLSIDWLALRSRSTCSLRTSDMLTVHNGTTVEEGSDLMIGGRYILRNDVVLAAGSAAKLGDNCQQVSSLENLKVRDRSTVSLENAVRSQLNVELLTSSSFESSKCAAKLMLNMKKSRDSGYVLHKSNQVKSKSEINLAVPPSDALVIKNIIPKSHVQKPNNTLERKANEYGWKAINNKNELLYDDAEEPPESQAPTRRTSSTKDKRNRNKVAS